MSYLTGLSLLEFVLVLGFLPQVYPKETKVLLSLSSLCTCDANKNTSNYMLMLEYISLCVCVCVYICTYVLYYIGAVMQYIFCGII